MYYFDFAIKFLYISVISSFFTCLFFVVVFFADGEEKWQSNVS